MKKPAPMSKEEIHAISDDVRKLVLLVNPIADNIDRIIADPPTSRHGRVRAAAVIRHLSQAVAAILLTDYQPDKDDFIAVMSGRIVSEATIKTLLDIDEHVEAMQAMKAEADKASHGAGCACPICSLKARLGID